MDLERTEVVGLRALLDLERVVDAILEVAGWGPNVLATVRGGCQGRDSIQVGRQLFRLLGSCIDASIKDSTYTFAEDNGDWSRGIVGGISNSLRLACSHWVGHPSEEEDPRGLLRDDSSREGTEEKRLEEHGVALVIR